MRRISLEELLRARADVPYSVQCGYIMELMEKGEIKPLRASGTNGKKPAMFREYWKIEPEKDYAPLADELKYRLDARICIDYYLSHLDTYEKERRWVLMLSEFLGKRKEQLSHEESENERSFEIWNEEKFLCQGRGRTVLKHCGLEEDLFNIYKTSEPLAYYSHTRETPQNMVILENKDTFYSMRKFLLDGGEEILGMPVGTLIYGAGKKIIRSFQDFSFCAEPYMEVQGNRIFYFGDLDYEGIGIYEKLAGVFREEWEIIPFAAAYERMLEKAEAAGLGRMPDTKKGQNRNIKNEFFAYFPEKSVLRMKAVLEGGKYIPQEILNISDFY